MAGEPILNRDTALSLLRQPVNPFVVEDLQHPWSDNRFPLFESRFLEYGTANREVNQKTIIA